jgi:superfamily II DNA or RNA helicase
MVRAMLRPYQHKAITQLYAWFERNSTGNPCIVLPTGSGKSHIIAHRRCEAVAPRKRAPMTPEQRAALAQRLATARAAKTSAAKFAAL